MPRPWSDPWAGICGSCERGGSAPIGRRTASWTRADCCGSPRAEPLGVSCLYCDPGDSAGCGSYPIPPSHLCGLIAWESPSRAAAGVIYGSPGPWI